MRISGLKDEEIVKKRRRRSEREGEVHEPVGGHGEVFVCDGEQEGPGTQNGRCGGDFWEAWEVQAVWEVQKDFLEIGG